MSIKVFISYSHKDESFKEELVEHLSSLKRNNIIDLWHDRCITAGAEWKNEIDSNLADSNIILFLVSSSFLASDYCMNKEAKQAMEQHDNQQSILIPIILRAVDWHEEEISRFQALPKDAKPINSHNNKDEAWLDVVNGIKKTLETMKKKSNQPQHSIPIQRSKGVDIDFLKNLDITDIKLSHRKLEEIKLSDIFVYPDIVEIYSDDTVINSPKSSKIILENLSPTIIFGEEQLGKTSLLKMFFIESYNNSDGIPLFISASDIKSTDADSIVMKAFNQQYPDLNFSLTPKEKIIILIDDFDSCKIKNNNSRNNFIEKIKAISNKIIISASESFKFIQPDLGSLADFSLYELKFFGYQRREELIRKWVELGDKDSLTEEEIFSNIDDLTNKFKTIISNNIVPSKPIYLIIFLQMQEAVNNQNLELSSYGHYYQQLIYQSFNNAKINKNQYDKYLNILTELSFFIFTNKEDEYFLNAVQLNNFFMQYKEKFLIEDNDKDIIDNLVSCSILLKKDDSISFKYPYIFYFFIGKKLADGLSENNATNIQQVFISLLESLHLESHANILIFLTHHTKSTSILNQINTYLGELFCDILPSRLTRDEVKFMTEFMQQIPDLVLEQRNTEQERKKYNEALDNMDSSSETNHLDKELQMEMKNNDLLSQINKSFKAIEIAGQIIRNRNASIEKDVLTNLAEQGISTGLRFLKYFLDSSEQFHDEIIELIRRNLKEHPTITNEEIEKNAENIYLQITYGIIYGVIRKIAASIGSKDALQIYAEFVFDKQTNDIVPANLLINQAINLFFGSKQLDVKKLKDTYEKIQDNPVCVRLLKELVIQHTYMFPVSYQTKQQISNLLNLPFRTQVLMDKQKQAKI